MLVSKKINDILCRLLVFGVQGQLEPNELAGNYNEIQYMCPKLIKR